MAPTAFVSYSWDSQKQKDWVRALAERLRSEGIDIKLDQWEAAPGDQLPEYMERGIREHSFVVVICTPAYRQRSEGRIGGVGYEGSIMTAEVMTRGNQRKFIPVLRRGSWQEAAPSWLLGKYYVDLSNDPYDEEEYTDLVTTLLGIRQQAPPLGGIPAREKAASATKDTVGKHPTRRHRVPSQFEDVRIVRVILDEITEPRADGTRGSALYTVPFQLSSTPPHSWVFFFLQHWKMPPQWSTRHRPGIARVSGSKILLEGTTIEEVRDVHRDTLKLVIDAANRDYRENAVREERERRAKEEERARHRRNVRDVGGSISFE